MELGGIIQEALYALVSVALPLLAVSLCGLIAAVGQALLAARDESFQYAVRVMACVGVLAIFGGSFYAALQKVMEGALR